MNCCEQPSEGVSMLVRICKFMTIERRIILMKAFIKSNNLLNKIVSSTARDFEKGDLVQLKF